MNKFKKDLEQELIDELAKSQALDEYYYYMAEKEEETRREREGIIPGVTLNSKGIQEYDIPRYDEDNAEEDDVDDEYAEYEDMPLFEKIR